jgi:hypothetical protein
VLHHRGRHRALRVGPISTRSPAVSMSTFHFRFFCTGASLVPWAFGAMMLSDANTGEPPTLKASSVADAGSPELRAREPSAKEEAEFRTARRGIDMRRESMAVARFSTSQEPRFTSDYFAAISLVARLTRLVLKRPTYRPSPSSPRCFGSCSESSFFSYQTRPTGTDAYGSSDRGTSKPRCGAARHRSKHTVQHIYGSSTRTRPHTRHAQLGTPRAISASQAHARAVTGVLTFRRRTRDAYGESGVPHRAP